MTKKETKMNLIVVVPDNISKVNALDYFKNGEEIRVIETITSSDDNEYLKFKASSEQKGISVIFYKFYNNTERYEMKGGRRMLVPITSHVSRKGQS